MRLEKIAIWRETGLFTEQADGSRGYRGLAQLVIAGDRISSDVGQMRFSVVAQYE